MYVNTFCRRRETTFTQHGRINQLPHCTGGLIRSFGGRGGIYSPKVAYFREEAHKADTRSSGAAVFLCLSISMRDATVLVSDGGLRARPRLLCSFDTEIVLVYFFLETKRPSCRSRALSQKLNNGNPVRLENIAEFNPLGLCKVKTV